MKVILSNRMQPITNQQEYKKHRYFGDEVKTLCIKENNHSRAAKPRQSTIQKKKLTTKQSYSHNPNAVVVPQTLTRTYTRMPFNKTSYLKSSPVDSFSLKLLSKVDFNG